jgi:hypothetical protein
MAGEFSKCGHLQRPYSRAGVRGLVFTATDAGYQAQPILTVGADLHLAAEAHAVLDVLARHPDVVGDLIDLVVLPGAGRECRCQAARGSSGGRGRCPIRTS